MNTELNQDQLNQLQLAKNCFPFRKVSGALNPETGEFVTIAQYTMRGANDYVRKGWKVWKV